MLSLALLQNKLKRAPVAYEAEFRQQLRSFQAQLSIFALSPPKDGKEFGRLMTFLSQVAHLYPSETPRFVESLLKLMESSAESMDPEMRRTTFQALVLLRNRGQLDPLKLLTLCFSLFRCKDKVLRELVYVYIIRDIRNVNRKAANLKLNKAIQNVVFSMLEDPSSTAAMRSLQVVIDLYKKRVWIDSRTVNVIAQACLSNQPKNIALGLQFFLGIDEKIDAFLEEEDDDVIIESLQASTGKTKERLELGARKKSRQFSKLTKARERKREKEKKALKKARLAKLQSKMLPEDGTTSEARRMSTPRFPAIELINDPQGFSEKLFKNLKSSRDHFEIRLMMMNLVSRVIGLHKLLLLPFYSFLHRYLQPHQRQVTNILAYLIQASHDLVPPEEIEPLVKHIANNFINDRSGPEYISVGLNSIRELTVKVPLLTTADGMQDFFHDLVEYKSFKRDKSVVMASRSLLNLLREINPSVLQRKERGKFRNEVDHVRDYGDASVAEGVEGAELLQFLEEEARAKAHNSRQIENDEDRDIATMEDEQEEEDSDEEIVGNYTPGGTLLEKQRKRKIEQKDRIDAKRILTEEDFSRIKKLKAKLEKEKRDPKARRKNEKAAVENYKERNALLQKLRAEGFEVEGLSDEEEGEGEDDPFASDISSSQESDSDEDAPKNDGSFDPANLEGVVRRKRRELAERLASVYEGRRGAHELSSKRTGGSNNLEKNKHKNFLMVTKSDKVRRKQTASFKQQQDSIKKHIKTLEKSKKTVQKIRRRTRKSRS